MPRDSFPSRVAARILRLMLVAGVLASCTGGDDASRGVQSTTRIETSTLRPPVGELRTDQALDLTNAVAAIATSTGIHDDGPAHGHVLIVSRDGSTAILPTQGIWFARVAFDGRQVLAQDRTSDYALGPNPFAIEREFATSQHGILLVEGEGQYSAWFNSGIPPGQSDWRVDVSRGGPTLTADHYPLMGIHLLGRCAGRTLGLSVSPDAVHIEDFRAGTHTPLGAAWRGEPPGGMSKPMPCNGDELVAVVNQGGDPAPAGQVNPVLVRIATSTGQVTRTPLTVPQAQPPRTDVRQWAASAQHVSSTTLTWGDGRGALYATRLADGATTLLRPPLRDLTAAEALHWAFAGERALLLDESAASLITHTLDGREISRTAVPGLAALLRSSGERVTDLAAVHP